MQTIIEFYQSLAPLDLFIFWGIITVIILLLIFSIIMLNKNKKLKKYIDENNHLNTDNDYDAPISKNYLNENKEQPPKKETTYKNQPNDKIEINNQQTNSKALNEEISNQQITTNNNQTSVDFPTLKNSQQISPNETTLNYYRFNQPRNNNIETENKFIAEEHIMEYNQTSHNQESINNQVPTSKENKKFEEITSIEQTKTQETHKTPEATPQKEEQPKISEIKIPNKPYERNVLREMSLGQTSPIGITHPKTKNDDKIDLAKDLSDSLNDTTNYQPNQQPVKLVESTTNEPKHTKPAIKTIPTITNEERPTIKTSQINNNTNQPRINPHHIETPKVPESKKETTKETPLLNKYPDITQTNPKPANIPHHQTELATIKKELENLNRETKRQTHIINDYQEQPLETTIDPTTMALLNSVDEKIAESTPKPTTTKNETYLEEVSRKLADAEVVDEIERTDYELEQEENAIISYKELMAKKDTIKTIDEEEAVISIEELMKRNQNKTNEKLDFAPTNNQDNHKETDSKLYQISDTEENDNFIEQLKQFRNDL